ncbi:MAG: serine hydrolase, partial [Chloroflexota bacterium]
SPESRDGAIDVMKRQTLNSRIPVGVPDHIDIAHKTGSLRGVRNDAGIVYAEQPYVISLFSKHLSDEREGERALVEISEMIWNVLGDE